MDGFVFFLFFFHISPRGKKGYLEKGVLKLFALQFLDFKSIGLHSKFLSPETKLAIALFSIVFIVGSDSTISVRLDFIFHC